MNTSDLLSASGSSAAAHAAHSPPWLSVVIKTYNEEAHIETCLRSVLEATGAMHAEVIVADSCSSDATVARAAAFDVRVVQLADPQERCCGIAAQLGYQHASGRFVLLMDGDMRLCPDFLPQALTFLQTHPEAAGVGGQVVELNLDSLEYRARQDKVRRHQSAHLVDRLDGGGLYRRQAIESVGHFSNRNLHSYEEFELALRLRLAGWTLWRLPVDAVTHRGHAMPPYALLARRWQTGYICGLGELLRASLGQARQRRELLRLHELRLYLGVMLGWLALAALLLAPLPVGAKAAALALWLAAPVALMAVRKRSWRRGLYAVLSWQLQAAGLVRGLLQPQRPPLQAIASCVLQEARGAAHAGVPPTTSRATFAAPLHRQAPPPSTPAPSHVR